jgi:ribosomal protein S11
LIVSLTNRQGEVISWASAGKAGFRGSKKNTPYAAQVAASDAGKVAYDAGLRNVEVYVSYREQVENLLLEPLMDQVSKLLRYLILLQYHITDVVLQRKEEFNHYHSIK